MLYFVFVLKLLWDKFVKVYSSEANGFKYGSTQGLFHDWTILRLMNYDIHVFCNFNFSFFFFEVEV